MPRPPKSVKGNSKIMNKSDKRKRLETEEKLKGGENDLKPSTYLNANQKRIFQKVVSELSASGILGNVDNFILDSYAIAVDRLQEIEKSINKDFKLLLDKHLMASKSKYSQDFIRLSNELSLSPSSRAKFGVLSVKAKEDADDPLLKLLYGGKK